MNAPAKYVNNTISLGHINAIMSLISLMSNHFLLNSFTLVSDLETNSAITFLKTASKYYIEVSFEKLVENFSLAENGNKGYIVLNKPGFDFSKVISGKPKLIAAVYNMNEEKSTAPKFLPEVVIPFSVPFFTVLLGSRAKMAFPSDTSSEANAKCFRLYKPISSLPLRVFPTMFYGGPGNLKWTWETNKMDWNFFQKETLNMDGVNIVIALASVREKKAALDLFWTGKNSFFWRAMSDHLHFRSTVYVRKISTETVKSITKVYLKLLMTIADGLAVLPVISSERNQHLEYILTGLDSKYHLMVRTPQYVYSWQSIFRPFAFESWMFLGIIILLLIVTLRIVTYYRNLLIDLSSCCLIVFGFICSQGSPNLPNSLSTRLVCYTTLLFSLIMYQFYTSNFYSLLSTKEVSLPFTSLEQFIAKRTHALYVHPDTAIYAHIVKAENGTFKKLWDEFLQKDPSHKLQSDTRGKAFSKVCKGTGAIFGLPFQTVHLKDLLCKVVPVNSGYFPTNIVTVVRKNFPFKSQFKFVHLRLLEAGISHKFRDEHFNLELQYKIKADVLNEPVSLDHVAFLFIFQAVSIFLSWLVLGLEILTFQTNKRKKIKKTLFLVKT